MISQRNIKNHATGLLLVALFSGTAFGQETFRAHPSTQDPTVKFTLDTFKQWETDLSNWGRWGPNDQRGTLNLITPARRRAGAAVIVAEEPAGANLPKGTSWVLVPDSRDTAKMFAEPVLQAWSVNYVVVECPEHKLRLVEHFRACQSAGQPGIVVLAEGPG